MTSTRQYTMNVRAVSVGRTRDAMLRAVLDLGAELPFTALTLPAVAARAGVSVQTIMRHFGSRDGLIDAAIDLATREEVAARQVAPGADADTALRRLLERYDTTGDRMLALLEQERHHPRVRAITDHGRALHQAWLAQVFAPELRDVAPARRAAVVDLLVVATDLGTWKLLRRDRGLEPAVVMRRMRQLVEAAFASSGGSA